jgi:hypothetical protein
MTNATSPRSGRCRWIVSWFGGTELGEPLFGGAEAFAQRAELGGVRGGPPLQELLQMTPHLLCGGDDMGVMDGRAPAA